MKTWQLSVPEETVLKLSKRKIKMNIGKRVRHEGKNATIIRDRMNGLVDIAYDYKGKPVEFNRGTYMTAGIESCLYLEELILPVAECSACQEPIFQLEGYYDFVSGPQCPPCGDKNHSKQRGFVLAIALFLVFCHTAMAGVTQKAEISVTPKTTGHEKTIIMSSPIVGKASWYSSKDACGTKTNNHPGCPTASGKSIYQLEKDGVLFAAFNGVPFGTKLKVTNLDNGKTVDVVVLDRGGFDRKYKRKIDLGKKAFKKIASSQAQGIMNVSIQQL